MRGMANPSFRAEMPNHHPENKKQVGIYIEVYNSQPVVYCIPLWLKPASLGVLGCSLGNAICGTLVQFGCCSHA